ncbi:DUF6274 family protein [Streptomyces sparsogenes]|uniref:DUF6274 family protein n=1 Tax=Streptomyces sparsogenes TaxID=67365 RepID=UPI0033CE3914
MTTSARHETRALLRAHLAAAVGYRHFTRHCPICHRLLRLAMDSGAMDSGAIGSGAMDPGAIGSGAMDPGAIGSGAMDSVPLTSAAMDSVAIEPARDAAAESRSARADDGPAATR